MAFTRVVGPGIHTQANINSHNIQSTGIITATRFDGPFTNLNVTGVTTFGGDVSIGGTLTYEDVTNIDSVGIITAQKDIHVGAGVSAVGVGTFGEGVFIPDSKKLEIGNAVGSGDLQLFHNPSNSFITNSTGQLNIQSYQIFLKNANGSKDILKATDGYGVELYHNGNKKFESIATGAEVFGTLKGASEVGIQSGGVQIGAGITQLNFVGTGNTFAVNGTTVDISIQGGGVGAGGTWSSYTAGIATTKSVGINTNNLDDNDLVGVGNSFQGLYISNGMIVHDNTLNGNHYIGTTMNGLMAGPVNIEGTLTIDGNYVVV